MPDHTAATASSTVAAQDRMRDSEAEYALEYSATCPHCDSTIKTVKVIRLLRTRVNFTSSLPRRGRVLICPSCRTILAGELTLA
jgi:hypothetical protein